MSSLLLVPIHLDALCLKTDLPVVEAKVDFTRLPYWDGAREVNPDVANLSEELLARPFQDRGLQLRAGVHLHWALPDALTRGRSKSTARETQRKLTFPAVPNRWLVTRSRKDRTGIQVIERQWVVESDYLHPDAAGNVRGGTAVPFPSDPDHGKYQRYRYLGRKRAFTPAWEEDLAAESLTRAGYQLTAVGYEPQPNAGPGTGGGYGEPTFAAFYPNCQDVFGLYDPLLPVPLVGTQYEVLGWYSNRSLDCLHTEPFLQEIQAIKKVKPNATHLAAQNEALKEAFKWQTPAAAEFPDRIVCYARLIIATDTEQALSATLPDKAVTVAVGNTGTEALSAYLASALGGGAVLEEQLEALHLSARLEGKELDVGLKFKEARHEKGFTSVPGGTLWSIREESAALPESRKADNEIVEETLPDAVAHLLNRLNLHQQTRDRAAQELESMQKQLFADWYKYMLCAYPPDDARDDYPDVDEVRYFIEKNDLLPIKRQQTRLKALDFQCRQAKSDLTAAVTEFNKGTKKPYVVQPRPAPRYWLPNEPTLLIVDEVEEPTKRHNQDGRLHPDGLLACQMLTVQDVAVEKNFSAIRQELDKLQPSGNAQERIGFDTWKKQPWNPFSLEWRVELFPRRRRNNLNPKDRDYHPDFITGNYQLAEGAVDLTLQPGKEAYRKAASVYSGSSLLTPHAKLQLQNQLKAFLEKRQPPNSNGKDSVTDALRRVYERLKDPRFHAMAQALTGFNEALLMHKQTLQLPVADPLGFDDARPFTDIVRNAIGKQNRSAPQPLDDFNPIRSGVLKILALRLVDTFGRTQSLAPQDQHVMGTEVLSTPGAAHLISLPPRLVQPTRLNFRWLAADRGDAANADEMEMNAHPATTPVCGWLIPNNLDNSLMVYDNTGRPLGSINQEGQWVSAPGVSPITRDVNPLTEAEIENHHLRTLINHLTAQAQEKTYFDALLTALEGALENIDPESFSQHEALALLMGRPIAVVRATLDLELRGQPAINQEWNVFRLDVERDLLADLASQENPSTGARAAARDTDQFAKVRFPIRLGDERQLNDGLVGYWKEAWPVDGEAYTYEDNRFYVHACDTARVLTTDLSATPTLTNKEEVSKLLPKPGELVKRHSFLARLADGDAIWRLLCDKGIIEEIERDARIRYAADEPELFQAIDSPPQKLTMLVDPRGAVHATSGILPTKTIRIPPDQYVEVLRSLAITFLSTPILTTGTTINLPLPTEPGHAWSWLAKSGDDWAQQRIDPVNTQATWSGQQEIREGWLKLTTTKRK